MSGIVEEETEHTREIEQAPASSDVLCAPPLLNRSQSYCSILAPKETTTLFVLCTMES